MMLSHTTQLKQTQLLPLAAEHKGYIGRFTAMGSPCEVLMRDCNESQAQQCMHIVKQEVFRIEKKYSRYSNNNIVSKINRDNGLPVAIDAETARLIQTANALWEISEGLFDITSGCLRRAWNFNGSEQFPEQKEIDGLLKYIGWNKVDWSDSYISLPPKYEIDFGGIGKEYAADSCLELLVQSGYENVLINLGGDIAANYLGNHAQSWAVGVESVLSSEKHDAFIHFSQGGIATSGDANKYLIIKGVRYSHVLNPRTGWPVYDAPQSVTVSASSCSEAGMYSTLAMLHGVDAEKFLDDSGIQYWVQRAPSN